LKTKGGEAVENRATIAVSLDKSMKNKLLKFCNSRGLRLGKFAERALLRELEYEGGKDVLYTEDVPAAQAEPPAQTTEKPIEQV
jgi:hypothetical protein